MTPAARVIEFTMKGFLMIEAKRRIDALAADFGLRLLYAFGSRAQEALALVKGKKRRLAAGPADLDIGIMPEKQLTVREKVKIAQSLESVFGVPRVDLVVLPDAPAFLALEIVGGELLYAADETDEAEYQLYVMRRAADVYPFERIRREAVLGAGR